MLFVLVGFVITIISFFIGLVVGYLIGAKKLEKKVEQIKNKFKPPPVESGPIKPYTQDEKEEIDDAAKKRFKELI